MFEIPLFPLDTVLFPGMPLQLHIFEDRYKHMIRKCLAGRRPFGVVLIRHGQETMGPLAEPYDIGCTARILEVKPLSEGRMNIVALGQKRFRVLSINHTNPYLMGEVEYYPLRVSPSRVLSDTSRRLFPWVKRYMQILTEASEMNLDPSHLPSDPLVLGYLAAVLLQIPSKQKQQLLALEDASDFLESIYDLYRREVALLRVLLSREILENIGQFSVN